MKRDWDLGRRDRMLSFDLGEHNKLHFFPNLSYFRFLSSKTVSHSLPLILYFLENRHPVVAFFHVFFRAAALLVYFFCGLFGTGFITSFVTVVILLALDFWTVKNITGQY